MDKLLGSRIREVRRQKGLTLEEVGEKACVCYKYIGEIERGEKNPTVQVLQRIAQALEIQTCLLLANTEAEEKKCHINTAINKILQERDLETLTKIVEVLEIIFVEKGKAFKPGSSGK